MPKFRKKPVVIEAVQWTGTPESADEVLSFARGKATWRTSHNDMQIDTLEGAMTVSPGDWVIKGVKNEFYPIKPDIFESTYEPVE